MGRRRHDHVLERRELLGQAPRQGGQLGVGEHGAHLGVPEQAPELPVGQPVLVGTATAPALWTAEYATMKRSASSARR